MHWFASQAVNILHDQDAKCSEEGSPYLEVGVVCECSGYVDLHAVTLVH
jgi:hypothetical protein